MEVKDKILGLVKVLLPDGRAYSTPIGSSVEGLYKGIIGDSGEVGTLVKANEDIMNVLDVILPDNDNFTLGDAHAWYRCLGIYDSGSVSLEDMKAVIRQRLSWASVPLEQQTNGFIQEQLVAAGFSDVVVYRNNFGVGGEAISPNALVGSTTLSNAICGGCECGETEIGTNLENNDLDLSKCVNYLPQDRDSYFVNLPNYRSTFYIAKNISGSGVPYSVEPVEVGIERAGEFRVAKG